MRILVLGAGGFLGRVVAVRLAEARHAVIPAVRNPASVARAAFIEAPVLFDLAKDGIADWLPRLAGIDAVVNAVGIFREGPGTSFRRVHQDGPIALFDACRQAGIRRIVQISALGADAEANTAYHRTKKAADDHLRGFRPEAGDPTWAILRPSVVIGRGGASTELFAMLGRMPLRFVPAGETWRVQPVDVNDLADAALAVLEADTPDPVCLDLVGPVPMTFDALLDHLGHWAGGGGVLKLPVGHRVWSLAAALADHLPGQPFGRDALAMLRRGNTGDPAPLARWLGRPPRSLDESLARLFLSPIERLGLRMAPYRIPLRLSLAAVWIITGIVSLGVHPPSDSLAMLAEVGLTGPVALGALIAASLWDLGLGVALLIGWRVPLIGWLQIATMVVFTLVIAIGLPEWLTHPFGPVLKNLPILVSTLLMIRVEEHRHG
jgi:uncharacterized protein YbjT (DUF2867 family)